MSRLPLSLRLVIGCALTVAIAVGAATAFLARSASQELVDALRRQIEMETTLFAEQLAALGPIRVEDGKLFAGDTLLNGRNEPFDRLETLTGQGGTLFLGDLRVATSVRRPDGTRVVGSRTDDATVRTVVLQEGRSLTLPVVVAGQPRFANYVPLRGADGRVVGMLGHGRDLQTVEATAGRLTWRAVLVGLLASVLGAATLFFAVRRLLRPVGRLAAEIGRTARGEAAVEAAAVARALPRTDELGILGRAVRTVADARDSVAQATASEAAARALAKTQNDAAQAKTADHIERALAAIAADLSTAAGGLQRDAGRLAELSDANLRHAEGGAASAGAAAQDTQVVAAATEQMTASVQEIARQVADAAAATSRAVEQAHATDDTVRGLAEGAERIGGVVRLIGDIAGQTNLLALNATIEAARAGEAGKGFAVVASEVKQLAAQTAKATDDITGQIAAMQALTARAVEAIHGIGSTIEGLAGTAGAIAAAVEQQGAATREIARGVAQAAAASQAVGQSMGEIRRVTVETRAVAGDLRSASDIVAGRGDSLTGAMNELLGSLRRSA